MRLNATVKIIAVVTALNCALLLGLTQCSSIAPHMTVSAPKPTASRYGSYLAARFAASERDAAAASTYFDNALRFDPANPQLLERAILSQVAEGDLDGAAVKAEALIRRAPETRIPQLVIAVQAMRDRGFAKARKAFERVAGNAAAEIAAKLGVAYASYAEGNIANAKAALTRLTSLGGARAFALYHQAVIEDLSGKSEDALLHFEEANRLSDGESLRILQAYATALARNGQVDRARSIYETFLKQTPGNPVARRGLARLAAGNVPDRVISNASQGMAETFYGIASSLTDENAVEIPVFYLQLALALEPNHELSLSLLADRMEVAGRFEDAIAVYGRIPATSPLYPNARQQIAQNYQRMEKPEEALNVLRQSLTGAREDAEILSSIGDVQRSQDKYVDAIESYTKAIALIGTPQERNWTLYYTRGISYERANRWKEAEADLKFALVLKPDQPLVMNYLAYSWVEQRINIKEALDMLQRAVDMKPDDGFIVDSLGWAHYRLGDFQGAVRFLEKAVLLEPGQATVNDHLGDAYWRLGRKLEARFQWQHALTLKPGKADEDKIRSKLAAGLDDLPPSPAQAGEPAKAGQ